MFTSRTVVAVLAAVIALLGCGPHSSPESSKTPPVNAAAAGAKAATWTLGGVPCCTLIAVPPVTPPVGTGTCPGVRPGAIVLTDIGQCTLNFLFRGSDGSRYVGTAGHCILGTSPDDLGETSWAPGKGPAARDSAGNRIGEFAYAILQDPKDFSLVRLDPQTQANAAMCVFGGPTGINDDPPGTLPVVLKWFGNGIGAGSAPPARSAKAAGMPSPNHVFAQGAATPGDSGSGVISSDGRAVGALVTVGAPTGTLSPAGGNAGLVGITRLTPQVDRAQQLLGTTLTLQSAPLLQ